MKPSILNQDIFTAYTKEHKIPSFRIKQVYQEIFNNQHVDFAEMTTLSKDLRETLAADFALLPFTVDSVIEDKKTTKI
jgi:adenine C2-methylase RlmN of 23S rRNA A2503 and tRNA A37